MNLRPLFVPGVTLLALVSAACSGTEPAESQQGTAATSASPGSLQTPSTAGSNPGTSSPVSTTAAIVAVPSVDTTATTNTPTTTTTTSTTTTTTLPPSPINGLSVADPETLERRVMAVKVDNHPRARPQSGLEEAEAVFELLVEGGFTRFIALFHATDATYVGPIRSLRPTDPTLLRPLGAPMQISGAARWVKQLVGDLGVEFMGEVARGSTFRISSRRAPYNLYGDTTAMRDRADADGLSDEPPAAMFVFGSPPGPTGEAERIELIWSGSTKVVWIYEGSRYLRFHDDSAHEWIDLEGGRSQIAFDTLLVLTADHYTARPTGGLSGLPVPAFETVGEGSALLFHEALIVEGTWSRSSIEEPFSLLTESGETLVIPPGRLWISVFPTNRTISWE